MSYLQDQYPINLAEIAKMRSEQHRIAMLTAYDATFAALCAQAGVDVILIGDSLGNVVQGHKSTLAVTMDQMVYHTECVARAAGRSFLVGDLPFGSYQESREQAFRNATRLLAAGAQMVKLEGGEHVAETVRFLVERGIPVCGHIGLTPQSVHQIGGYRVQGRTDAAAAKLKAEARALEQAGAALIVVEVVPAALAAEITAQSTSIATIGIGAGPDCHGQVLVVYDTLGLTRGRIARFVRNFMNGAASIEGALAAYVRAVKDGSFPGSEHTY